METIPRTAFLVVTLLGALALAAPRAGAQATTSPAKADNSRTRFLVKAFQGRTAGIHRAVVRLSGDGQEAGYGLALVHRGKKQVVATLAQVDRAKSIKCRTTENLEFQLKVLARDLVRGVALMDVIDLGDRKLDAVALDGEARVAVGRWVLIAGQSASPLAVGVVGAVDRNVDEIHALPEDLPGLRRFFRTDSMFQKARSFVRVIQHDAPMNDQMIGAPLVDSSGKRVVGVCAFRVSRGTGYAIPVDALAASVSRLASGVDVTVEEKPVLGVMVRDLRDDETRRIEGLHAGGGAYVEDLVPGAAAAKNGVMRGDIIVSVNETDVYSSSQVVDVVRKSDPREEVRLGIVRGGRRLDEPIRFQPDRAAPSAGKAGE